MPEEPSFSSTPLSENTEPEIKKPRRKRAVKTAAARSSESLKETKISKQLAQIYQDESGHLPDMKKIKIKKTHSAFKTFFGILLFGGVLAAAAWVGLFFMPGNQKFAEDKIEMHISGPATTIAGATTTYTIAYENNQGVDIKKAILNVQYPDGFVFSQSSLEAKNLGHTEWDVGSIPAGKKKELSITGIMYGSVGQKQSLRAFLTYQPANFGSELQTASIMDITTDKSPFTLTVAGSNKTTVGNASEYIFTLKKQADSAISKIEIKPSWPKNFALASSSPALTKDLTWVVEPGKTQTSAADTWTYKLTGNFSSSSQETGDISGALLVSANNKTFSLLDNKITTELAQNDVNFNLAINGSLTNFNIQPGGNLNLTLSLKNQSSETIKNATVHLSLTGPAIKKQTLIDWPKIKDTYDGDIRGTQINDTLRKGEIIWDKNKIPELASVAKGKEITIDISLPLRDASAIDLSALGNSFTITALADVSFRDVADKAQSISSNQIAMTVNSDLAFEARDSVSGSGAGAKHQINWVLTNNFHPLKNVTLVADVFGDVSVSLPEAAPAGEINYNAGTKKITWNIPAIPESVDVLALPFSITLNKINPTQNLLISKVHVQAEDTVTGEKLDFMGEELPLN